MLGLLLVIEEERGEMKPLIEARYDREIQTVTAGAEARTSWSCPLTYLVSGPRERDRETDGDTMETESDLSALSLSL